MLSGLFPFLRCAGTAAGLLLCLTSQTSGQSAAPQSADPAKNSAKNGIWFQVKAAIKPVPKPKDSNDKSEPRASLNVQLRISAHADGSRFFGYPSQKFDFKLSEGSEEKLYWQDAACHPRRGLPRIFIVGIDGQIEQDGKTTDVKALPRKLGKKLPPDEISAASSLVSTSINGRQAMTFQAGTSASKLNVQVTIYMVDCAI